MRSIGSTAGRQKFSGGFLSRRSTLRPPSIVDRHVEVAGRHIDAARHAPARRPWPRPRACRSPGARCSARMVVKVAGMCWVTNDRQVGHLAHHLEHLEQRLRAAGRASRSRCSPGRNRVGTSRSLIGPAGKRRAAAPAGRRARRGPRTPRRRRATGAPALDLGDQLALEILGRIDLAGRGRLRHVVGGALGQRLHADRGALERQGRGHDDLHAGPGREQSAAAPSCRPSPASRCPAPRRRFRCLATSSIAALPLPAVATTLIPGSLSSDRVSRPRITCGVVDHQNPDWRRSGVPPFCNPISLTPVSRTTQSVLSPVSCAQIKPDLGELRLDDLAVERLHDVFVGAGADRFLDVGDVVLGGAEHHDRRLAAIGLAQLAQEVDAAHHRHVPVQQDRVGHALQARIQGLAGRPRPLRSRN